MYDPIGLVTPYTVKARLLLKDIWSLSGQQWDDDLPPEDVFKFLDWSEELPGLSDIVIPRAYFQGKVETLELHLFGESSQDVFSAVAFLRAKVVKKENREQTQLAFVLGKAGAAPMKALIVPKLELQASLLAARLRKEVEKALTLEIGKTFMWSDSTTVLHGIHSSLRTAWRKFWILPRPTSGVTLNPVKTPLMQAREACQQKDLWTAVGSKDRIFWKRPTGHSSRRSLQNLNWNLTLTTRKQKGLLPKLRLLLVPMRTSTHQRSNDISIALLRNFCGLLDTSHAKKWGLPFRNGYHHGPKRTWECTNQAFLPGTIGIIPNRKETTDKELPAQRFLKTSTVLPFQWTLRATENRVYFKQRRTKQLDVSSSFDAKHPVLLDSRHPVTRLFLEQLHRSHCHQSVDYLRASVQQQVAIQLHVYSSNNYTDLIVTKVWTTWGRRCSSRSPSSSLEPPWDR